MEKRIWAKLSDEEKDRINARKDDAEQNDDANNIPTEELPPVSVVYGHHMQQCQEVLKPEDENYSVFLAFRDQLFYDAAPFDALEGLLVDRLVALLWRMRRAGRIERELFERIMHDSQSILTPPAADSSDTEIVPQVVTEIFQVPQMNSLNWLQQYESQLERSVYRALAELRTQQDIRIKRQEQANKQNGENKG